MNVNECIICLDEIKESDPLGKAWLSCSCKVMYHATCIYRWLYVEDAFILGKNIHKGCPVCKKLNDDKIYIVDFIPPHTEYIKTSVSAVNLVPRRTSFMTRLRELINIFH
jgi:hypothetical protein